MRTSEFYITVIGLIGGVAMALHGIDGGAIAAALSPVLAYTGGRSYAKRNA